MHCMKPAVSNTKIHSFGRWCLNQRIKLICLSLIAIGLILQDSTVVPDSYELALLGECLWSGTNDQSCQEISWNFRPIGPAFLMGPLLLFFPPLKALELLSAVSVLGMCWVLMNTAERIGLKHFGVCVIALLWCAPTWREVLSVNDARTLVLGFVFGAWYCAVFRQTVRGSLLAGFLIGWAALIRPEQLLAVPLLLLCIAAIDYRRVLFCSTGAAIPLVPWFTHLSLKGKTLVLVPRHWESGLVELANYIPVRWAQQILGMGIWKSPLRAVAVQNSSPTVQSSYNPVDWSGVMKIVEDFWNLPMVLTATLILLAAFCSNLFFVLFHFCI